MSKAEADRLYKGKFFYEIVNGKPEGPYDNILYVSKHSKGKYAFVQVIDGKPVQAFTKDQILVTTKRL